MIRIVGAGPGAPDYLTEGAMRVIKNSCVVVGRKRILDELDIPMESRIEMPDLSTESVIGILEREAPNADVTLVVSGDPGFYSLARSVVSHFGRESVSVTPGISSIQIMAARLCRSWAGVSTTTLHGRYRPDISELAGKLEGSAGLVVLLGQPGEVRSDIKWMSQNSVLASARAAIGWDMGLSDERIFESDCLEELRGCQYMGRLALLWLERNPPE